MIEVRNPATGEVLERFAWHTPEQVEAFLSEGPAAPLPLSERVTILRGVRQALVRRAREAAECVAKEQGKPVVEALVAEVFTGLDHLRYALDHIALFEGLPWPPRQVLLSAKVHRKVYVPRGTVLLITPWNYPFAIPLIQTVQAVAAGNRVLLKCAPATPLSAGLIEELFKEAGAPAWLVRRVLLSGPDTEPLVKDPRVRQVLFTGSTRVGRKVGVLCAEALKPCTLELGGKDPAVILDDADLDLAVPGILWGALMNTGQTCASIERVYVARPLLKTFTERLCEAAGRLRTGDPLDPETDIGPMTLADQRTFVDGQVKEAVAQGAKCLLGGAIPASPGYFYPPTILSDVRQTMRVMDEETFGPLIPIMAFDTEEEAVTLANAGIYGLTASVWTTSRERAERLAPQIAAGTVTVNDHVITFAEPSAPWHGLKSSGLGASHGMEGLTSAGELRLHSYDFTSSPRAWWYPYSKKGYAFFLTAVDALHGAGLRKFAALAGLTMDSRLWTRAPWLRIFLKPWRLL